MKRFHCIVLISCCTTFFGLCNDVVSDASEKCLMDETENLRVFSLNKKSDTQSTQDEFLRKSVTIKKEIEAARAIYPEEFIDVGKQISALMNRHGSVPSKKIDWEMAAKIVEVSNKYQDEKTRIVFTGWNKTEFSTRAKCEEITISDSEVGENKAKNRARRYALIEFYFACSQSSNECLKLTISNAISHVYGDSPNSKKYIERLKYDGIESFADIVEMSNVDCARKEDSPNNQGNATNENQK